MNREMLRRSARYWTINSLYYVLSCWAKIKRFQCNQVQFLSFHAVRKNQVKNFKNIIEHLSENYQFVGYSEAVGRILSAGIDKKYVALSFDDGYKNWVDVSELLNSYGIKACFFVNPKLIEAGYHKGDKGLAWSDIDCLLSLGHEVGGHTSTHVDLGRISASSFKDEIGTCYEILLEKTGVQKHFAWPYGKFNNITRDAKNFVYDSGYKSCASAVRGAHMGSFAGEYRDLCIRRDNIEPRWPLNNIKYFLLRNRLSCAENNKWPDYLQ